MNNFFNNIILYFLTVLILHLLIKIYLLEDTGVNFINAREYYNACNDTTYNENIDTSQYYEDISGYNKDVSNTINDYGKDKPYFVCKYKSYKMATSNQILTFDDKQVKIEVGDYLIHLGEIADKGNLDNLTVNP